MEIKEMSYQELTGKMMLGGVSDFSVSELKEAIEVIETEIKRISAEELHDAQVEQLDAINKLNAAKVNNNEGELTYYYDKLMAAEKKIFEAESAIDHANNFISVLNNSIEEKSVDMPKPRI